MTGTRPSTSWKPTVLTSIICSTTYFEVNYCCKKFQSRSSCYPRSCQKQMFLILPGTLTSLSQTSFCLNVSAYPLNFHRHTVHFRTKEQNEGRELLGNRNIISLGHWNLQKLRDDLWTRFSSRSSDEHKSAHFASLLTISQTGRDGSDFECKGSSILMSPIWILSPISMLSTFTST